LFSIYVISHSVAPYIFLSFDTCLAATANRYQIAGLPNNIEFLGRAVTHPAFAKGQVDTGFIATHLDDLVGQVCGSNIQNSNQYSISFSSARAYFPFAVTH
jgi:acetyl/propionyl-CoA carboxylase alpha subunit